MSDKLWFVETLLKMRQTEVCRTFRMQHAISHYCQKCRAANPLGQEFCLRCGTRLMIVVQPPSARVAIAETTPNEEHFLERLTILENTLARLAERLEQGLKLLLRQSETSFSNHAF